MSKHLLVLVVIVLGLSLTLIELRHRSRLKYAELQTLHQQRDALNVEWGKLLLEEGAWSQHNRIENLARTRLDMILPRPDQIVVVDVHRGDRP